MELGGRYVTIHTAFIRTFPFEADRLRYDARPLRGSPAHVPKHVSGTIMLTKDHVAGSAGSNERTVDEITPSLSVKGGRSLASASSGVPGRLETPVSAQLALEEARKVVRQRRQAAKDRQAMSAASAAASEDAKAVEATGSDIYAARGNSEDRRKKTGVTAKSSQGWGALRPLVDISRSSTRSRTDKVTVAESSEDTAPGRETRRNTEGNRAVVDQGLRTYNKEQGRGKWQGQGRGGGSRGGSERGGRGVSKGRVLPDFTGIDVLVPRDDDSMASSGDGVELQTVYEDQDASALALVAAIRSTLISTAAQVEERKAWAVNFAGTEDGDGGKNDLQDEFAPEGWLRAVGLIRRACAEVLLIPESKSGKSGNRRSGSTTTAFSGNGTDLKPPPRIAFELALEVCCLCARPDAGLEVLSLMRTTGLEPALEAYKAVMDGYSVKRRQGRALFTLQTMMAVRKAGIVPDLEMLSVATEACARARDREGTLHFTDQAFRLGLTPDERMYREAIIAYSQTGRWIEARDLALHWRERASAAADAAAEPSTIDASNGPAEDGSSLPPLPPAVCNTAILKAMGKAGRVDDVLTWLADIAFRAKSDDDEGRGAGGVRRGVPRKTKSAFLDHSSFLAALSACSRAGRWESAIKVLRTMEGAGIAPEAVAFNTAFAAFEQRPRTPESVSEAEEGVQRSRGTRAWRAALELLAEMEEERGLEPDVVAYNRVINILRWAGQGERALELLESMKRRSEEKEGRARPDVITYNSAIAACAAGSGSKWKKAIHLLNEMQRKGLRPDRYSYTSAIHACAKSGNPAEALRLLRAMEANEVSPDVITMTACIDALASGGRWPEAIDLLDEMRTKGIAPNERTYQAAIQACGKGGQWQRALELLALLEARPSGATVQEYNCAMMACVDGSEPVRALDILERIKRSKGGVNTGPDMVTYTSAITACAAEGMWKTALELLQEMRRGGKRTRPNIRSYTAAIAACGRAGMWRQALELHSVISEEGIAPDAASFNAVISAARRGGQHDLSMELLASMLLAELSPDSITVAELLSSLSDRGKWDNAIQVLEIAARTGAIPPSSLDGDFEVDVSHLPSAIAKVKVRATLKNILGVWRKYSEPAALKDLVFVTGTGTGSAVKNIPDRVGRRGGGDDDDSARRGKISRLGALRHSPAAEDGEEGWQAKRNSDRSFNLGRLLAEDLRTAYSPPLQACAPTAMAGCLVVSAQDLVAWASAQDLGVEASRSRKK